MGNSTTDFERKKLLAFNKTNMKVQPCRLRQGHRHLTPEGWQQAGLVREGRAQATEGEVDVLEVQRMLGGSCWAPAAPPHTGKSTVNGN